MSREYRIRVDLNVVVTSLTSFEIEMKLLFWAIVCAEEALAGGNRFWRGISSRGDYSLGIILNHALLGKDRHFFGRNGLERPEIARGERPHRELILYEFVEFFHCALK